MTDPADEPLPEWTDDEIALLRSAELDRPRSQSLPAVLAAVGVGGAIATSATAAHGAAAAGAAGAAASAKWGGVAAASKWLAVVALTGTVVAGAVVITERSGTRRSPAPSAEPKAAAPRQSASRAITAPAAVPAAPIVPEQAPATPTAAARPAAPSASSAKRPVPSQPDIRVELAVLDGAMKSLRAGDAAATLAALDRYDRQYAKTGTLQLEARALRIEALMRSGRRAQANALAAAFLSEHPTSPHAPRIRALLGEAASKPARP